MSEEKKKAILIMDMPSGCADCPVCCRTPNGNGICLSQIRGTRIQGKLTATYTKPDWCPLRKVPEKKEQTDKNVYCDIYKLGYNACIDDFLGGA